MYIVQRQIKIFMAELACLLFTSREAVTRYCYDIRMLENTPKMTTKGGVSFSYKENLILAKPDDTSSRSLAFRALNYGKLAISDYSRSILALL